MTKTRKHYQERDQLTSKKAFTHEGARLRRWPCIAGAAILISTSGCVVTSDEPSGSISQDPRGTPSKESPISEDEEDDVLARSTTTSTKVGGDLQIDIYALERVGEDLLRLRLGVTNNSSESFSLGYHLTGRNRDTESTGSGITLIDAVNQQRYLSYEQSNGICFCSPPEGSIEREGTKTLWVIFPAPPEDLEVMTVVSPAAPPMMDVPISISSEELENNNLKDREVLDLTFISDSTENQTGRTESGDEVSILLSSDVLFDTNSSELSNEAQNILSQVAQEIDDASSSIVSIDGHADNVGNNSVNIPLSEDRAKSVESTLNDLLTREGVIFEVEGHGSADPIADNNTEEGRERNRRVSVTFEK